MKLYTTEEKHRLLEEWKSSGLSANKFRQRHGIAYTTFLCWTRGENLTERRSIEGRKKYREMREQGLSPWKTCLCIGAAWDNCRRWEQLWQAGKLGV